MSPELAISLAVFVPLVGALLILATGAYPNLREAVTLLTAALLFALVATIVPDVFAGQRPSVGFGEMLPGLGITFTVEPLGAVFALVASFLWIITSIYSIGYMRGNAEKNQTRFYVYFAIALASTIGVAFAGNMLTLFVFYEVLTVSTFPLVAHAGSDEAKRAGRLYLGILLGTSIGLQLIAIVWTWVATGTLDFTEGGILDGKVSGIAVPVLLALYAFGIGKAALMPFHRWLPAAMVAPTPVSALLHAVAVVKAGVFSVVKVVVYVFGVDFLAAAAGTDWLLYVSAFTIIAASIIALRSDNLKRRLAYSTVSQLSYIVLGAALATGAGVIGGGMHLVMHAFGKITLFFCAGAIYTALHKAEVSEMAGIGRAMPVTMGAFFVGSLSVIGLPPMGGIWSKWQLMTGAVDADQFFAVIVLMVSSLLSAAYLLPVVYTAFFGRAALPAGAAGSGHPPDGIREAPMLCVAPLCVSAAGTIVLFFYGDAVARLLAPIALQ